MGSVVNDVRLGGKDKEVVVCVAYVNHNALTQILACPRAFCVPVGNHIEPRIYQTGSMAFIPALSADGGPPSCSPRWEPSCSQPIFTQKQWLFLKIQEIPVVFFIEYLRWAIIWAYPTKPFGIWACLAKGQIFGQLPFRKSGSSRDRLEEIGIAV